jgi:hypothetical protein
MVRAGRRLHTEVDVTETAASNLAADSVLVADAEVLLLSAWVQCSGAWPAW